MTRGQADKRTSGQADKRNALPRLYDSSEDALFDEDVDGDADTFPRQDRSGVVRSGGVGRVLADLVGELERRFR